MRQGAIGELRRHESVRYCAAVSGLGNFRAGSCDSTKHARAAGAVSVRQQLRVAHRKRVVTQIGVPVQISDELALEQGIYLAAAPCVGASPRVAIVIDS